jgi:hypothetical protein
MLNRRLVSAVLVLTMLTWLGVPALAADTGARSSAGPQVNTAPAPLSAAEMARYGQLQAAARQQGVLAQKGGTDSTTWMIIGVVGFAVIVAALVVASEQ